MEFGGRRVQLHKSAGAATVFGADGGDRTQELRALADAMRDLPVEAAIIEAEVLGSQGETIPGIDASPLQLCAWCFDLLQLDGADLRSRTLLGRRIRLRHLILKADDPMLRYSEEFEDPAQLLRVAGELGFAGIVSKRGDQPYRAGSNASWIMVKAVATHAEPTDSEAAPAAKKSAG